MQLTEEIMDCQSHLDINKSEKEKLEKQLKSIITKYPEMKQKVRIQLHSYINVSLLHACQKQHCY